MEFTDAELRELDAEVDRIDEETAEKRKQEQDLKIKSVNIICKTPNGYISTDKKVELDAEIDRIKEETEVHEEPKKDLKRKLDKAQLTLADNSIPAKQARSMFSDDKR